MVYIVVGEVVVSDEVVVVFVIVFGLFCVMFELFGLVDGILVFFVFYYFLVVCFVGIVEYFCCECLVM